MFHNQIVQFGDHSVGNICLLESNDLLLKQFPKCFKIFQMVKPSCMSVVQS